MKIEIIAAGLSSLLLVTGACAQENETRYFEYAGSTYRTSSMMVEVRDFLGREALFLERAVVWLEGAELSDGVYDYDVAAAVPSGFVGANFRVADEMNYEQYYARYHQSNQPDSIQYMPTINGMGAWQIHAGPNDATVVEVPTNEWTHTRIVVQGDKADIFVGDMETPALHIEDLLVDSATGPVAIFASDRPGQVSGAYFSNVSVRGLAAGEGVIGTSREETALPDNVVWTWEVSDPFDETLVATATDLDHVDRQAMSWRTLEAETNGVTNLARLGTPLAGVDTVFARMMVTAEEAEVRMVRFGYSDRVRVYLNGELLFFGNAKWRSRDHRFLGTIGWEDQMALHLQPGDNELLFAVSEDFGGWGITAAMVSAE